MFGLPRPGSARFMLRERIKSYTKDDLQDLLRLWTGPLLVFLTAVDGLRLCIDLAVCGCAFCEQSTYARAVWWDPICSVLIK